MEVKLLSGTMKPIDVMYAAARTCYSAQTPIELFERYKDEDVSAEYNYSVTEKRWKLVKAVLDSGHLSIAEHVNLTFAICGISRACSHQLVRHRLCTYSQQSQRYVEIKENAEELLTVIQNYETGLSKKQDEENEKYLKEVCDKYFVNVGDDFLRYAYMLFWYLAAVEEGEKPEDARMLLPNATKTNLVMTLNLRQLIHICQLRLCVRAQKEIRQLFKLMVEEVNKEYNARFGDLLGPSCELLGYCPEDSKSCGKKPTSRDLMDYNSKDPSTISSEDMEQILNKVENPEVNEKLQKLLSMQGVFE